jgi:hypothetical protein
MKAERIDAKRESAVAVLDAGGMDDRRQAHGVGGDVPLASLDLLAGV